MKTSRKFRPTLESLDARDLPATLTWLGTVSTSFDLAANWSSSDNQTRIPAAGDDIVFAARETGSGGGGLGTSVSVNSDGMYGDPLGAYASVTLASSYTGVVTLSGGFTTGGFTLANGTIDQPGTDITVTGAFDWTGGKLNSTPTLATLHLQGDATISPGDGNTLTGGDTFSFENSSTSKFTEGTVSSTNGAEMLLTGTSKVTIAPAAGKSFTLTNPFAAVIGATKITLNAGTSLTVSGNWNGWGKRLANDGGTFEVTNQATVTIDPFAVLVNDPAAIFQSSGVMRLHSGTKLVSGYKGVELWLGSLTIVAEDSVSESQRKVTIDGDLKNLGATIQFTHSTPLGSGGYASVLYVTGDVEWTGGAFKPNVDATNMVSDSWVVAGEMVTAATAKIDAQFVNVPQNLPQTTTLLIRVTKGRAGTNPTKVVGDTNYNLDFTTVDGVWTVKLKF